MGCDELLTRAARFLETDLYMVITESFCGGRSALDVLDACLAAGVRLIQLREKELDGDALYERAEAFRARTQRVDALLIINDRVDLALAVHADGVHLGQNDLPISAARAIAPGLLFGISTHTAEQAITAQEAGADYVNVGPIYTTQTKTTPMGPLGLEGLDEIVPHLEIPYSCMGGIKASNIADVVARGCRHPAVVTAVTQAKDVHAAASELRRKVLADA